MNPQEAVREFHEAFGLPVLGSPDVPVPARCDLRAALIREEAAEAVAELDAMRTEKQSVAALAKELADVLYVTYGCAHEFGIDLDAVFCKVHESNMSKLGPDGEPVRREDGKVLKGPNYKPVNLDTLLEDRCPS